MKRPIIKSLSNGLKVVYVKFDGIETTRFELIGRVGCNYENPDEFGVAHFLEHVLFDGSQKYPSRDKLKGLLLDLGYGGNGSTGRQYCNFDAHTLKKDIEIGFEYLSQLILEPLFSPGSVVRHKKVIDQEIKKRTNNPSAYLHELLDDLLFDDENRSRYIGGTVEGLQQITTEKIHDYWEKNYVGSNFVLGVCTDLPENKVFDLAEKFFSKMPVGLPNDRMKAFKKREDFAAGASNRTDSKQAKVVVSYWAYEWDNPKRYPFSYVSHALGGSPISRIPLRIRQDQALAYSVGSSYKVSSTHGLISIDCSMDESKLIDVLKTFDEEISKLKTYNVSDTEYSRVRNSVIANFVFKAESPRGLIDYYTSCTIRGEQNKTIEDVINCYERVEKDQIRETANEIFSKEPKIAVLSRSITKEDIINAWGLNKIPPTKPKNIVKSPHKLDNNLQ
ncbi:MAG: pitrilysin family protein [Patescibacteria group bacterium]